MAANELGTDTDTIATMAGALLGACGSSPEPPERPLDADYLVCEADRLAAIAAGEDVAHHPYPDILTWAAPRTQADALVRADGQLAVEGLGAVSEIAADPSWTARRDFAWQWVRTDFGQTLLIKRRPEVRSSKSGKALVPPPAGATTSGREPAGGSAADTTDRSRTEAFSSADLQSALTFARKWIDQDDALGHTVRRVAEEGTLTDLVALVTELREDLRC